MQLTYYNNKTDRRYMIKNIEMVTLEGHTNPVTIKLLEETSIAKPVFKMRDKDLYMTANYCYVDSLHRYYYILDRRVSEGYGYLECEVDAKMSFAQQLHDIDVLVDRNQWDYNLYQKDDKIELYNFTSEKRLEFPSGFDRNAQRFMLCVVGNTSETEGET